MSFPFRVHIHLGAHKTATTFIQNWLGHNHSLLCENQIAYIPLATLRQQFTPCFWEWTSGKSPDAAELTKKIRGIINADIKASGFDMQTTKLLVLSEENLLGSLGSLNQKGILYPGLAERMQKLAVLFEGCEVQAFLSIRNFCEFYPSAYAETLRHGHIKPFGQFINKLDLTGNSWLNVVAAVEAALGPATLWPYEQFRGNVHQVLSALLNIRVIPAMIGKPTVVRPSLTLKGLEVAMGCRDTLSVADMKKLVNLLIEKMVFEQPDGRIAIKNSAVSEQLDTQYRDGLEQLAGRLIACGLEDDKKQVG